MGGLVQNLKIDLPRFLIEKIRTGLINHVTVPTYAVYFSGEHPTLVSLLSLDRYNDIQSPHVIHIHTTRQ